MKTDKDLRDAALRWLEYSGALGQLRSAMVARAKLNPPPKVLKVPVYVNIGKLNEIEADLVTLVMRKPMKAQKIFHQVIYTAAVAISLELKPQPISDVTMSQLTTEPDHCPPSQLTSLPDMGDIASLYSDEVKLSGTQTPTKDSVVNSIDKVDFDLALTSLELDLPIDTAIKQEAGEILTISQIHTPLRVDGIPWFREWVVGGVRDLPRSTDEDPVLALVTGRVMSLSLPKSYTVWARYLCSSEGCVGMARDLHMRVFAVGGPDADDTQHKPHCRVCRSELEEDPSSRELGEKSLIFLLPDAQSSALTREVYTRVQLLKITLRDEMLANLAPGQKMQATVMIVSKKSNEFPCLEGILVHPPAPLRPPSSLPPLFRQLVRDRQSSPWSLVLTLAYMFGTAVVPAGTFHSLKLALLLSLASCSPQKAGLAVLVVGSNTTVVLRLLWYGAKFASHSVIHSSLDDVTASFSKDHEGKIWVQAGSLLLAHGGVCVLGDFSKFKKEARRSVCNALESGMVLVEAAPRLRSQTPTLKYPLRAAAWACYDPAHNKGRTSTDMEDMFLRVPLGDLTKSISDVFGLVIYTETPGGECESKAEEEITLHTLLNAMTPAESQTSTLLRPEDLKEYLAMARSLETEFSAGAEKLIRGYYVAARRLRGDCVQGSAVPVTAIHTLAQAAASHARLALRSTVETWDAVAAILLCEEGLAAHFGYSLLQVPPTPHLSANADLHILVGRKNDERMANFQRQLENFITVHTGDIPSTLKT
ncbi:minichromosome maintenance domain-containing protein 2-like isoform X2 [Macrobrachium rosenbergii]